MKYLLAVLLMVSACAKQPNQTFILQEVYTYPEERNVLIAVPIKPVLVEDLD